MRAAAEIDLARSGAGDGWEDQRRADLLCLSMGAKS